MSALARIQTSGLFQGLFDWLGSPFSMLRPFVAQPMRLEHYVGEGHYVVRRAARN